MRQSKRYVLLFTAAVGLSTLAMAAVSALAIENAYAHFAAAPNKELAAALWRRMAIDAQIGLLLGALGITAVAIPVGIGLWRISSRRHQKVLRQLETLAHERLGLEGRRTEPGDEESVWEEFVPVLVRDLAQLRDKEKVEAWKDGARLLMHELKNPMTPLKLSAQRLALDREDSSGDVGRILSATESMERILGYFKNLVNVEFGAKERFEWRGLLAGLTGDFRVQGKSVSVMESYASEQVMVEAERTLLKMVLENLVNNGLEARPEGIGIRCAEKPSHVEVEVFTPGVRVPEPERMFRPGQSSKGKGRGYGLFLCKTISDYLNLELAFRQDPEGASFTIRIPKTEMAKA